MLWLFPVAIWFAGSYFLLGKLGKWSDDYSMTCFSPVTGEWTIAGTSRSMAQGLWRPINQQTAGFLQTTLWHQDRLIHTITAVMHALTAWMLFRFLRRAGVSKHAAAAGGVLFLGAPMGYEVIFWAATIGTTISLLLALAIAMMVMRLGNGHGRWAVFVPVGLVVAFLIACGYEQSATACAAMPLLYLGATDPARGWARRLLGTCGVAAVLGLGCVIYVIGVLTTVSTGMRGSSQTFVDSETIGRQARGVYSGFRRRMYLERFAAGAWEEGLWRLAQMPVRTGIAATLLALGGFGWVRWWAMGGTGEAGGSTIAANEARPERSGVGRWWLLAFAVAAFFLAFLPIIAIRNQGVESRLIYWPAACVAIMITVLLDWVLERLRAPAVPRIAARVSRGMLGASVAGAAIMGCVLLIGVQSVWMKRSKMDRDGIAQLKTLMPDPKKGTVFVSVGQRDKPVRTGSFYFDGFATGVWHLAWTPIPALRIGYKREDVFGISCAAWTNGMDVENVHERGLLTWPRRWVWGKSPDAEGRHVLEWERIVPIRLDPEGRVEMASAIVLELPDGRDVTRPVERVAALGGSAGEGITVRMGCDVMPGMPGIKKVTGWAWRGADGKGGERGAGEGVQFTRSWCWEITHPAARMAVRGTGWIPGDWSRMSTENAAPAAANGKPRVLHFRVTAAPEARMAGRQKGAKQSEGAAVEVYLNGAAEPAARLVVDAKKMEKERRWMDLACPLPEVGGGDGKTRVEVRIAPVDGMKPTYIWVSPGAVVEE